MNNKKWIFLILLILAAIGISLYFFFGKNTPHFAKKYQTAKISTNKSNDNNNSLNTKNTNINTNTNNKNTLNNTSNSVNTQHINNTVSNPHTSASNFIENNEKEKSNPPTETQISTFSTKILSRDSARQNNVSITCNKLNNTIVKKGEMFSFCNTVGPATADKGYQDADIFDHNGNKKKGLGGGNCQVSSTLYNALLAVPQLVVTERHKHSKTVHYAPKDKDAAVAYGSYDLKFRNNLDTDLKITCSTDAKSVTVTLFSLTY